MTWNIGKRPAFEIKTRFPARLAGSLYKLPLTEEQAKLNTQLYFNIFNEACVLRLWVSLNRKNPHILPKIGLQEFSFLFRPFSAMVWYFIKFSDMYL